MESLTNKICPYCKTKIEPGEPAIMCPACGMPHHRGCWDANKGCTTFGCSEQHYEAQNTNPTDVCKKCGAPLGDGQAFCHKCGAPKDSSLRRNCVACGNLLDDGQDFCPKCGQQVALNSTLNDNIAKYNQSLETKRKKKKVVSIIIFFVLIIAAVGGIFAYKEIQNRRIEEERQRAIAEQQRQREQYISNAKSFSAAVINAAVNVEDIVDTIQKYWYENIWENKHGSDIDAAIANAQSDKSSESYNAIIDKRNIDDLYDDLKKVPDNISDYEIMQINIAVKELYKAYCNFYDMAIYPSGSYNSYSEDNSDVTDEFISKFEALNILLD